MTNEKIDFRTQAATGYQLAQMAMMTEQYDVAAEALAAAACFAYADGDEGTKAANSLFDKGGFKMLAEKGADLARVEIHPQVKGVVGEEIVTKVIGKLAGVSNELAKAA